MVASAGIRLGEKTGWFAALRYRYFGPRPLTGDDAFVSPATGLLNGQLGYRFDSGRRVQLDPFNLPVRPDHLRLRFAAKIGFAVYHVLSSGRGADRTGRGMPEQRDGQRAAPVEPLPSA